MWLLLYTRELQDTNACPSVPAKTSSCHYRCQSTFGEHVSDNFWISKLPCVQ